MASSASALLNLEQMATGENDGSWGDKANDVFNGLEEAIAGATILTKTGGTYTLTDTQYVANEARDAVIRCQGALTANQTMVIPNRSKTWWVTNETTGSYTLTVKTSGGTGVTVTQGAVAMLYCDGSDNIFYLSAQAVRLTGAPQSTGSGVAASAVSVTAAGNLTSTNAQAALVELQGDIDTINGGGGLAAKQDADAQLDDISGLAVTKGNIIAGDASNFVARAVGTDGQRLEADSGETDGLSWTTPVVDNLSKTKGNLVAGDGTTFQALLIGTDGQVLTADSAEAYGVKWAAAAPPANDSITNAMLADVATKTVKGRDNAGTGDPEDLTMTELATLLSDDATAVSTLRTAIAPFAPADDIRGTTETGSISIPVAWTTYLVFGWLWDEDEGVEDYQGIWRSSVSRAVESTQAVSDYSTAATLHAGFLVCIKVT